MLSNLEVSHGQFFVNMDKVLPRLGRRVDPEQALRQLKFFKNPSVPGISRSSDYDEISGYSLSNIRPGSSAQGFKIPSSWKPIGVYKKPKEGQMGGKYITLMEFLKTDMSKSVPIPKRLALFSVLDSNGLLKL
ncbi:unnamed protein product [Gordionus sp. m RMFG-2023]